MFFFFVLKKLKFLHFCSKAPSSINANMFIYFFLCRMNKQNIILWKQICLWTISHVYDAKWASFLASFSLNATLDSKPHSSVIRNRLERKFYKRALAANRPEARPDQEKGECERCASRHSRVKIQLVHCGGSGLSRAKPPIAVTRLRACWLTLFHGSS